MTTVRITYYGMEGSGRNVTEAKRDAGRRIEAALSGDYNPTVLHYRGYTILVHRMPEGWDHRLISEPNNVRVGTVHGCPNFETREEAIHAANAHLAQLVWEPKDGCETGITLDRSQRAEFRSWVEFQLRYREARARGLSETDAHDYASRNPARPELWTEGA